MSELDLLYAVIRMCDGMGLWWWHDWSHPVEEDHAGHRINRRGLPDLLVLGRCGGFWREIKSATGRHSLDQLRVQRLMVGAGWKCDTWRPDDMTSGRIARELAELM